jgi:hypothetical protein
MKVARQPHKNRAPPNRTRSRRKIPPTVGEIGLLLAFISEGTFFEALGEGSKSREQLPGSHPGERPKPVDLNQ